jgi:hypothetical protein
VKTKGTEPLRIYRTFGGCGAKNLALLQNQCKYSQLGKLINLITWKMVPNEKKL